MSEIGIISGEYQAVVTTTEQVNNAILVLKKQFLLKNEGVTSFPVSEDELGCAKKDLAAFINYLMKLYDYDNKPDYRIIPEKIVTKFKTFIQDDDDDSDFQQRIKSLHRILKEDKLPGKEQFALLDNLVTGLDKERSLLFKNLRSARG